MAEGAWLVVVGGGLPGLVATSVGYTFLTGLLKRHPAKRVAPFSLGVPAVGLAMGMLVLGETITLCQWGGIALLAAALAWVMLGGLISRAPLVMHPGF